MQISNIISLRGDDSPTDTTEYSTDSTIMGGNLMPQAHLLNSSSQTNNEQHPTYENNELQDVTQASLGTVQDVTTSDPSCKYIPELSTDHNNLSNKSIPGMHSFATTTTTARDSKLTHYDSISESQKLEPVINITPKYGYSQDVTPSNENEIHRQDVTDEPLGISMTQRATSDVTIPVSINMLMLQDSLTVQQHDLQKANDVPAGKGDSLSTSHEVTKNVSTKSLQDVTSTTVTHTHSDSDTYTSTSVTTCKGKADIQISSQEVTNQPLSTTTLQDITVNINQACINESNVTGNADTITQNHQLDITHASGVPTWTHIVNIPSPGGESSNNTIEIGMNLDNTNNLAGSSRDASLTVKHHSSPAEHNFSHSESLWIKDLCKSLGLPESVYTSNSDSYYPVLTLDESDIDYINFKDIINKSWSVPLDNLSVEDIELEQSYLKCFKTSSPKTHENNDEPSSLTQSTQRDSSTTENDNEKTDPTYGTTSKKKWPCDGLRWFKLKKMSKCQKDVKMSKRCQNVKKMSNVKKSNTQTMEEVHKKK